MPTYNVTDPTSGKAFRFTGDSPPTEAELENTFRKLNGSKQPTAATPKQAGGESIHGKAWGGKWDKLKEQVAGDVAEPFKVAGEMITAPVSAVNKLARGAGAAVGTLSAGGGIKQAVRSGYEAYHGGTIESPLGPSRMGKAAGSVIAPAVNKLGQVTGHPGIVNAGVELAGDALALASIKPTVSMARTAGKAVTNKLATEGLPFTDKSARYQAAQRFGTESEPVGKLDAKVQQVNAGRAKALSGRITAHLPEGERPNFTPGQQGITRLADHEATRRSTSTDPNFARRLDLNDAANTQAARENVNSKIPGQAGEGGRTVRSRIDDWFKRLQGEASTAGKAADGQAAPYTTPDTPQTIGERITAALTSAREPVRAAKRAAYDEVDALGYQMEFPTYKQKVTDIIAAAAEESEPVAAAVKDILSKTIDKARSTGGYDAIYKTLNGYLRDLKGSNQIGATRISSLLQDAKTALKADADAMGEAAAKGDVMVHDGKIIRPSAVQEEIANLEKRIKTETGKSSVPDAAAIQKALMESGDSSAMKVTGEKAAAHADRITKQFLKRFPDRQLPGVSAVDESLVTDLTARRDVLNRQLAEAQPAEDFAAKYSKATGLARQEAERFGRGANEEVFRQGNQASGQRVAAERLPARFATETGADDLARAMSDGGVVTAEGRKAAGDLLRDHFANEAAGKLADPNKLTQWVNSTKVKPVLEKLGLYDEFSTVGKARQAVAEAQTRVEQFQKSTVGKIMHRDPDDIVKYLMSQPDPAAAMREVVKFGKHDPEYVQGLKVAVRDHIMQSGEVTAEDILGATRSSASKTKRTQAPRIRTMMKEVFTPTEMQALTDFHQTIQNLSRGKTTPHGSNSSTAYLLQAKDRIAYGTARDIGKHVAGGAVNAIANMASALVKVVGKVHAEKIEGFIEQALLNPKDATLLTKIYQESQTKAGAPTQATLDQINARLRGYAKSLPRATGGVTGTGMQPDQWGKGEDTE